MVSFPVKQPRDGDPRLHLLQAAMLAESGRPVKDEMMWAGGRAQLDTATGAGPSGRFRPRPERAKQPATALAKSEA
jgi:hypothetical protein